MAAHKTEDGRRWRVWLNLGSDPVTGRRLRKKVEAKTKREAESKAAALRDRHQRGEDVTARPRTLGELLDDYLATVAQQGKAAVNTLGAYRRAADNQLVPRLGAVSVPRLRTRELQRIFNDLAERFAPAYIRLIKTVLVQALDFAIEQYEITINPAKAVRIPRVKRTPGRSLTPEEARAVLEAAAGHRYGLAIRLALWGMRRSELPGLMWDDFDEVAGTLMIRRQIQRVNGQWTHAAPKDGSARMLILGPKTVAGLQLLRRTQAVEREAMGWPDSGYIFVSTRDGGVCPPTTIYEAFRDIAAAAGIKPARLHDCRHTAATMLLSEGEDPASVAEVLGHANPQITLGIYAHALPRKVAGASRRLEDIYDNTDGSAQQDAENRQQDVV